jgi:hypothetical protein
LTENLSFPVPPALDAGMGERTCRFNLEIPNHNLCITLNLTFSRCAGGWSGREDMRIVELFDGERWGPGPSLGFPRSNIGLVNMPGVG